VLVPQRLRPALEAGTVTLLFRRWRTQQAVAGRTYRTAAGRLAVDEVRVVDPARVSGADARRAGYASAAELVTALRGDPRTPVYRLVVRLAEGPDPRDVLAAAADLTTADVLEIDRRLDRLDRASSYGPWTMPTLRAIERAPAVRAPDLAAGFGRETAPFKLDVRKLKALGLTTSLRVGYRLSPRGAAYLRATARDRPHRGRR
jgi:hypothetical protein